MTGLHEPMLKLPCFGHSEIEPRLRKNDFEFRAILLQNPGSLLGTHGEPVDSVGCLHGPVRFAGDEETATVQFVEQFLIYLQ